MQIPDINLDALPDLATRQIVVQLFNLIEALAAENAAVRRENQQLCDGNARLKGGSRKSDIKPPVGARRRVRKRDVSFGPQSQTGAYAWDTFQTLAATAAKLGLGFLPYLRDRLVSPATTPLWRSGLPRGLALPPSQWVDPAVLERMPHIYKLSHDAHWTTHIVLPPMTVSRYSATEE
ncbi:hypothetical protein [Candidatus Chloroploca asiatica]|uniref:Transposase n=1 Tax=Candidatus Chloroploca asiatica TaxID=1506545 RepID=A0A2H3L542_9CHLR|nr:hypothetical protein [Candidatus Chloroploca asiatica]PDV98311.1 hypothetical protein A9Q02_16040 [Candidatus Chloroploca asiatica]